MSVGIELILGVCVATFTLNYQIGKMISSKKEEKLLKKIGENTKETLIPIKDKIKSHDNKFLDFDIKLGKCMTEIGDIKVLIAETRERNNYIKETLEELKNTTKCILETTNRTREKIPYIKDNK